jgi:hypothetical protein
MAAALSTPQLVYVFPRETMITLNKRWHEWVERDATVRTRKDQSQDTPGIQYEMLLSEVILRPAVIGTVVIAEPRLQTPDDGGELLLLPFLPWPQPMMATASFRDGDLDTIWVMPRLILPEDFQPAN